MRQGNAAKTLITDEILNRETDDITVFDFECGSGQWEAVLRDHENISYIGYEPDRE